MRGDRLSQCGGSHRTAPGDDRGGVGRESGAPGRATSRPQGRRRGLLPSRERSGHPAAGRPTPSGSGTPRPNSAAGRVDHWRSSNQKQRWLAAALLNIEPRLRKLIGYRHLPLLRTAIQKEFGSVDTRAMALVQVAPPGWTGDRGTCQEDLFSAPLKGYQYTLPTYAATLCTCSPLRELIVSKFT